MEAMISSHILMNCDDFCLMNSSPQLLLILIYELPSILEKDKCISGCFRYGLNIIGLLPLLLRAYAGRVSDRKNASPGIFIPQQN